MTNTKGGGILPQGVKQTMEKVDKATGGVAGGVVGGYVDAGKDIAKGVAQAPMDILKGLVGGGGSSVSEDSGVEDVSATSGGPAQTVNPQVNIQAKMAEAQAKREAALRQARSMIAQYDQQHEKTKQEEEQKKLEEEQEEAQEDAQIKQLQTQKKQEALVLTQAKQDRGSGETSRKKH